MCLNFACSPAIRWISIWRCLPCSIACWWISISCCCWWPSTSLWIITCLVPSAWCQLTRGGWGGIGGTGGASLSNFSSFSCCSGASSALNFCHSSLSRQFSPLKRHSFFSPSCITTIRVSCSVSGALCSACAWGKAQPVKNAIKAALTIIIFILLLL